MTTKSRRTEGEAQGGTRTRAGRTAALRAAGTEGVPPWYQSRGFALGLLLVAITLLLYAPSYRNGFIWDDDAMVTQNPLIKASDGLARFWFSTEPPDYFPLVSTLLWIEWRLFGMNPAGYHVVQAMLHAAASVLLWRVLRRLGVPGAWWGGLLFAVHPVNVETVSWITETKNTLPMSLYLGAFLAWLRYDETVHGAPTAGEYARERGGRHSAGLLYGISLGLFVLALLGKTAVVMLPFVLLGSLWWRRGRVSRGDLLRTLPFFAASLALGLVTVWFQSNRAIMHTVIREDGFVSRLAIAARAIWFYLAKALFPAGLNFVYPRWEMDVRSPLAWLPLAGLVGGLAILLWKRHTSWARTLLGALGYFVLSLAPVLGFVNIYFMRYSYVADHWQYVAIAGVAALLAGAGTVAAQRWFPRHAVAAGAVVCALLAGISFQRQGVYRSNEHLFTDVLEKNLEAWIAHNNLGLVLAQRGELDRAAEHYLKALALKPDLSDAHLNLGNVYAVQKRDDDAVRSFQESLRLRDTFQARDALGEVFLRQGRVAEARAEFERAVALQPDFARAHANLAEAHLREKNLNKALEAWQKAVRIAPGNAEYGNSLARAYLDSGDPEKAVAELKRVLAAQPGYIPGYRNVAVLLKRQGKIAEARELLEQAVQRNPGNAELQGLLSGM